MDEGDSFPLTRWAWRIYERYYHDGLYVPGEYVMATVDHSPAKNYLKLLEEGIISSDEGEVIDNEKPGTGEPQRLSVAGLRDKISEGEQSFAVHGRGFLGRVRTDSERNVARALVEILPARVLAEYIDSHRAGRDTGLAPDWLEQRLGVRLIDEAPEPDLAPPTISEFSRTDIQQDLIPDVDPDQGMLFQPVEPGPAIPGEYGEDTKIEVEGKKEEVSPARYKVVEVGDLKPSHDFTAGAARPNPDYPTRLQPRDLTNNLSQVGRILGMARKWKARDANSPSEFATTGPPAVTPDGWVIKGNGRVGAAQLAASSNEFGSNKAFLKRVADLFGLDPAKIDAMTHPMLVREVPFAAESAEAMRFAAQGNISTTGRESPVREAERLNRIMGTDVLRLIDLEATTTRKAVTDPAINQELRDMLRNNLPPSEQAMYLTPEGDLTEHGVDLIENMVLTQYLPVGIVERLRAPGNRKVLLNTIEAAIPALNRIAANTATARHISSEFPRAICS